MSTRFECGKLAALCAFICLYLAYKVRDHQLESTILIICSG